MSKIELNNAAQVKRFSFSGGERHVELLDPKIWGVDKVVARIQSSDDLIDLFLLTDILNNEDRLSKNAELFIPYFPYARQDRYTAASVSFSLRVFANMINSLPYKKVNTFCLHSTVSNALINNVKEVHFDDYVIRAKYCIENNEMLNYASPDLGGIKRIESVLGENNLIIGLKKRNPKNGEVRYNDIIGSITNNNPILIVDDICDGGATFIGFAELLRQKGITNELFLFVGHGIFSKGLEPLKKHFVQVFTTNSFISNKIDYENEKSFLVTFKLPDF